ncbi:hypothetical protein [Niallia sp. 03133]|uniref:hypothetical protein n=1 Tax=Niallia sp. 03133 TaxID=3458060 RepID=UPI0040444E8C
MTVKVKLQDIIDVLDFDSEEWLSLIDTRTGEIVNISLEDVRAEKKEVQTKIEYLNRVQC